MSCDPLSRAPAKRAKFTLTGDHSAQRKQHDENMSYLFSLLTTPSMREATKERMRYMVMAAMLRHQHSPFSIVIVEVEKWEAGRCLGLWSEKKTKKT